MISNYTYKIFFSWQSDTDQYIIKDAIEKHIKKIESKYIIEYNYYPCQENSGSPDIYKKIIQDIKNCDVFIADLTNVGSNLNKKFQNSNTCYELGIAKAFLDDRNIIIITNKEQINDLFFDIKHDRITSYIKKNGKIEIDGLDKYIEGCFLFQSKLKILTQYNNTCPICLDNVNINDIIYFSNNFVYCKQCEKNKIILEFDDINNANYIDDINNIFNEYINHYYDTDKIIFNHKELPYIKKILDISRISFKTNKINSRLIHDYLESYFTDEYVIQYIEILHNLFSLTNYHKLLKINIIHDIIYCFCTTFENYNNAIIQNIITNIIENGLFLYLDKLLNLLTIKCNNKDNINEIQYIFRTCVYIYSCSNEINQSRIKELIKHEFKNKYEIKFGGVKRNFFNYKKIYNQIVGYGTLIKNGAKIEKLYKIQDLYFKDQTNYISIGTFRLKKYKKCV